MTTANPRPPPLPAKRNRHLVLLIVGIVLVVMIAACGGLFGCLWWLFTGIASSSNFSMEDYQCGKNIEELALIKEEWVTAHDGKPGDVIPPADLAEVTADLSEKLACPLDPKHSLQTSYKIGPIGTDPKCKCQALHEQKREEKKKKAK
ncbi:MAG: hypothetical protein NTY53_14535 [Kiritimatiellaeota bacterium]|nr:hypothetical protein [Kiritimatiellota bacterium]